MLFYSEVFQAFSTLLLTLHGQSEHKLLRSGLLPAVHTVFPGCEVRWHRGPLAGAERAQPASQRLLLPVSLGTQIRTIVVERPAGLTPRDQFVGALLLPHAVAPGNRSRRTAA